MAVCGSEVLNPEAEEGQDAKFWTCRREGPKSVAEHGGGAKSGTDSKNR